MINEMNNVISCIKGIAYTIQHLVLNHKVISVVALVELFPVIYMFISLGKILFIKLKKKLSKMLDRSSHDVKYKNRLASIIFFFADMGPNISSFSVIALFITGDENGFILTFIFFMGIMIKEGSRTVKHMFYSEIEARSS